MATLGSRKADRLLGAYLEALRGSNQAFQDYLRAIKAGAARPIRSKASAAKAMAAEVRSAREAFQQHFRKDRH